MMFNERSPTPARDPCGENAGAMRRPITFTLLGLLAALALPTGAAAATVTAQVASDDANLTALGPAGNGTLRFSVSYRSTITVVGAVFDDAGHPVGAGTVVHVSTVTTPAAPELALDDVRTSAAGGFVLSTVPGRSMIYLVHVDAAPGVAATSGPPLQVAVVPNVHWTTPLTGQKGRTYRLDGVLDIPDASSASTVVLYRLDAHGNDIGVVGHQRVRSDGSFHFRVRHSRSGTYRYRIAFVPTDAWRWAPLTFQIAVAYRRR